MLDYTKTKIRAGNGGRGIVGFRREKYVPKGGPDGGDGGHGGNVFIEASNDVSTLLDFQFQDTFEGQSGEPGGPSHKRGKDGQDITIKVPVGSVIKINKLVADIPKKIYGKRNQNEPKQYEQKMFNYKKMQKLKARENLLQNDIESPSAENMQQIMVNEQPLVNDTELETRNDNQFPEGDLQDLATLDQNESDYLENDEVEKNELEQLKKASQEYKIYKFSSKNKSNDNSQQAQIADQDIEIIPSFDLNTPGQRILIARGGVGGRGNSRFKSSLNQAPKIAEIGQRGEFVEIEIILKSVANVGIIGFPNAGKSTLLSKLTAASPKIANYPFTTLEPNLGVLVENDKRVIIADIPGLIEGASLGKGLGFKFLQHVERTQLLLHLIEVPDIQENTPEQLAEQIYTNYATIREELARYGRSLPEKDELICINKIDKFSEENKTEYVNAIEAIFSQHNKSVSFISAQNELGVNGLKKILFTTLEQLASK